MHNDREFECKDFTRLSIMCPLTLTQMDQGVMAEAPNPLQTRLQPRRSQKARAVLSSVWLGRGLKVWETLPRRGGMNRERVSD